MLQKWFFCDINFCKILLLHYLRTKDSLINIYYIFKEIILLTIYYFSLSLLKPGSYKATGFQRSAQKMQKKSTTKIFVQKQLFYTIRFYFKYPVMYIYLASKHGKDNCNKSMLLQLLLFKFLKKFIFLSLA